MPSKLLWTTYWSRATRELLPPLPAGHSSRPKSRPAQRTPPMPAKQLSPLKTPQQMPTTRLRTTLNRYLASCRSGVAMPHILLALTGVQRQFQNDQNQLTSRACCCRWSPASAAQQRVLDFFQALHRSNVCMVKRWGCKGRSKRCVTRFAGVFYFLFLYYFMFYVRKRNAAS